MKTLARVLSEMTAAFAVMLVVCMIFVAVMLPQVAEGVERMENVSIVYAVQLQVDGLNDQVIFVTHDGGVFILDQSRLRQNEYRILGTLQEYNGMTVLDLQTTCGVRAQ